MMKNFWRHLLCDLSYLIKAARRLIKNQKWRGLFKFPLVLKLLYVTNDVIVIFIGIIFIQIYKKNQPFKMLFGLRLMQL
jgi:hypothetical protein